MKMQVEIDDEILDIAFRKNLEWHINNAKIEIKRLSKFKTLLDAEVEEKVYLEKLLPALKVVGEYFGVK
jgi:hypothetical protein